MAGVACSLLHEHAVRGHLPALVCVLCCTMCVRVSDRVIMGEVGDRRGGDMWHACVVRQVRVQMMMCRLAPTHHLSRPFLS